MFIQMSSLHTLKEPLLLLLPNRDSLRLVRNQYILPCNTTFQYNVVFTHFKWTVFVITVTRIRRSMHKHNLNNYYDLFGYVNFASMNLLQSGYICPIIHNVRSKIGIPLENKFKTPTVSTDRVISVPCLLCPYFRQLNSVLLMKIHFLV